MRTSTLRQRVLYGFVLFSFINFFLLVALAIYSYHYSEDRVLTRLVEATPAIWRKYDSLAEMPQGLRDQMKALATGTHELSSNGTSSPAGSEVHVHVRQAGDSRTWQVLQFDEEISSIEVFKDYALFALLATVMLGAFGGWAAWVIAHRVSRPLEQLAHAVDRHEAGAQPLSFASSSAGGEVTLLGEALNEAFARVDTAMQREKTLSRNISHELRTPLTVISTSLHGGDDPDETFRAEALNRARRACDEMALVTAACLELSREPSGAPADPRLDEGFVEVAEATKQIVRESLHLIKGRAIEVDVSVNVEGEGVFARTSLVRLAVGNAVRNAFVHGASGHVQITVTDECLSIENPIDAGRAPNRWAKVDGASGYGLNILGQACERLGWRVEFAEKAQDRVIVSFYFASI